MSRNPLTYPQNPTHAAWLELARPSAQARIACLWKPEHRFAVIWTSPRRRDRKGRLTDGIENKESRLKLFKQLRSEILTGITEGRLNAESARHLAEATDFAHAIRIASSPEEAIQHLSEFYVAGNNVWDDGDSGAGVFWICSWHE